MNALQVRRASRAFLVVGPALYRLEQEGLLSTEWGVSSNNRRAKFYSLTSDGKRGLNARIKRWERLSDAMATALVAEPEKA